MEGYDTEVSMLGESPCINYTYRYIILCLILVMSHILIITFFPIIRESELQYIS